MKKKLDTTGIANELEGASLYFSKRESLRAPKTGTVDEEGQQSKSVDESIARSTNKSISKSTGQSTSEQTTWSGSKLVDRPKAFYITERLDKRIDKAVRYFQEKHGIRKVDRSIIVNVIMDNDANWSSASLDLIADGVISQLTSRLVSR